MNYPTLRNPLVNLKYRDQGRDNSQGNVKRHLLSSLYSRRVRKRRRIVWEGRRDGIDQYPIVDLVRIGSKYFNYQTFITICFSLICVNIYSLIYVNIFNLNCVNIYVKNVSLYLFLLVVLQLLFPPIPLLLRMNSSILSVCLLDCKFKCGLLFFGVLFHSPLWRFISCDTLLDFNFCLTDHSRSHNSFRPPLRVPSPGLSLRPWSTVCQELPITIYKFIPLLPQIFCRDSLKESGSGAERHGCRRR